MQTKTMLAVPKTLLAYSLLTLNPTKSLKFMLDFSAGICLSQYMAQTYLMRMCTMCDFNK